MNHSICYPAEAGRLLIASTGQRVSQPGIATEDWDLLFCAVAERLRHCASRLLAASSLPQPAASVMTCSSDVLECVDALNRLHAVLRQQRPGNSE
ncbi:hypothetical protein [Polaromonas sp.]|uniref:hypothetical protein n=1 Tax=Polaromonas sp. TaxID=1869339 RepID=UPI0013B8FEA2|nr:hypothetical protein [Polaromonas sp.]NDP64513.1 hypothetical protein [Polaromonas sp.]